MWTFGSITAQAVWTSKNTPVRGVFLDVVLSAGIEPASQLPQSCVLSIERRKHFLNKIKT
jgi:hypothetical protein